MIRKLTFLLLFTITCGSLRAGTECNPPPGFLLERGDVITAASAITARDFPNADTILVDDHVLEEFFDDGTSVYWDDEYTKILTEKGRRKSTSHKFHFTVSYTTSFVYRAEIIKPDGKIIEIDTQKYTRVMTEQSQMGMNIYNPDNKVLTLSTPGIEIGDICHITYGRVNHKTRMKGTWADYAVFEYDAPIVKLDYEIIEPPGLPIQHKLIRDQIEGTVKYTKTQLSGNRTRHLWKVTKVPQIFPEPDMPPMHTQAQRLLLSTAKDWSAVSRWYWELCQEPMSKTTPEMKAKVTELTKGLRDYHDKLRAIFKFVSQEIRYMGITTEDEAPGYEPHPVDMTFNNRYGVCRDKAALLAVMLRLADIPAYPVLIHAGAKMDEEIPVPYFNHAITAADNPEGGYILMDATDENTKELFPAYLCNRSYLVARAEGENLLTSEIYPAEKNMMRISSEGALNADGSLLLKTELEFDGINDNVYRGYFLRNKEEKRRKFFEAALKKHLAGAEVIECGIKPANLQDTSQPLTVKLTSRIPDYPVRGESLDMLIMPWLSSSIGYVNFVIGATGLEKRKYPMKTDITCGVTEKISLDISSGLRRPHNMPQPFTADRAGLFFALNYNCEGGKLSAQLEHKIQVPEFSPRDYLELKKSLKEIEAETRKHPLFVAGNANPPDHETLFSHTHTTLHTPESWTTTSKWSKRVLTYAGKRENSELKIAFNPIWQSVELVSATVSNANGKVFTVTDQEINLMDAGWTAAAPRYPAEKTLIVNLPGVETGSVITVETRSTRTNANFYAQSVTFGDTSPSSNERFELTWPVKLEPTFKSFNLQGYVNRGAVTNHSSITMSWVSENPPRLESEKHTPPPHFHNPQLFISFGDWKEYARTLKKRIRTALKDDDLARERGDEIVDDIKSSRAKILAIRDYVLRNIRMAGPSFLSLPLSAISGADTTLRDQYANKLDRAILMAAMLDEAGFNPEIIFAAPDRTRYTAAFQPMLDIPQPAFFRNPLVKVRGQGVTYYLNDGDQYTELGVSHFHDAPALNLKGGISYIEVPEEKRDRTRRSLAIDILPDGTARITSTNHIYGTSFGPFKKLYEEMLPEDRRRHYLQIVNDVAKSARAIAPLTTAYNSFPGIQSYAVLAPNYAVIENGTLTLSIPSISGNVFPVSDDTRKNPLFLKSNSTSEFECVITLPKGYNKVAMLPEKKMWQLPCHTGSIRFDVKTTVNAAGRTVIKINRVVNLASGEIPPELYPAILEYNRVFSHPATRTIIAEKKDLSE